MIAARRFRRRATELHQVLVAPIARRLFSITDAATYLGVSQRMVRTWTSTGRLPIIRFGRRVLLDRVVLDKFMETRQQAQAPAFSPSHPPRPSLSRPFLCRRTVQPDPQL